MATFNLKDSSEYYLSLSNEPKRFDADSPFTNVFFDDTNGQVFTVRSGGVADTHTVVTVSGIDDSKSTSFRIDDKGSIISIKFSLDYKILAIQRHQNSQNATVDFVNFKDLAPTNLEYSHTCKWKNAKILGFVWPKVNEIAFITDYGIELLQVLPEKKQLKSLKSISFSGAWFSWCSKSNVVVLAGNNGALLQPFGLNNSTITKLQKLELETARPVVERDVFVIRVCDATWCAIFRHCTNNNNPISPTEVWLMPISGAHVTHILKTGQTGRFAVSVVDDLIVVHHQASQTSQLFDIMEDTSFENNTTIHHPVVAGISIKPAVLDDMPCPMYSDNWVVFQPQYIIDARLGCFWTLQLLLGGLAHCVPKDDTHKIVSVLLRRCNGQDTVYQILNQMIGEAATYLAELSKVFDEVNVVYRRWAEHEVSRITAGVTTDKIQEPKVVISQADMCARVLHKHAENKLIVQVVTAYIASLCRNSLVVQSSTGEACVRSLVTNDAASRLRSLVRRGALGDSRPLACQLLSLGAPPADQLAVDMLRRTGAHEEIVEVLLSWSDPIAAIGYAKQSGSKVWNSIPARKLLAATQNSPADFVTTFRALVARNEKLRGSPAFLKDEHCEGFTNLYKQLTSG